MGIRKVLGMDAKRPMGDPAKHRREEARRQARAALDAAHAAAIKALGGRDALKAKDAGVSPPRTSYNVPVDVLSPSYRGVEDLPPEGQIHWVPLENTDLATREVIDRDGDAHLIPADPSIPYVLPHPDRSDPDFAAWKAAQDRPPAEVRRLALESLDRVGRPGFLPAVRSLVAATGRQAVRRSSWVTRDVRRSQEVLHEAVVAVEKADKGEAR